LPWSPVVEPLDSPFIEPGFAAFLETHPRVPSYSSFFSFDIALRMNFTRGDYCDKVTYRFSLLFVKKFFVVKSQVIDVSGWRS
jgi:hypothetical protein